MNIKRQFPNCPQNDIVQNMASNTLKKFDISPTRGFVPHEPLIRLPVYFNPWEKVCDELPTLWKNGTTRSTIEKLPLLDHGLLSSEKEWYRAFVVLTFITHSYVWCQGEQGAIKVLPKCVAVPLCGVSSHTGLPPVITHYGFALCNWRQGTWNSDLEVVTSFTGTKTEEGFCLTATKTELEFGKGGPASLLTGKQAILDGDINLLITSLESLQNVILNMKRAFLQIHDVCDAQEFYNVLRVFLTGWGEGSPLVEGLVYEGVSTEPMKYAGGSASQSTPFHVIDTFLGITHHTETGEKHFLTKMRMHMPPKHRAFIDAIANGPSLIDFVLEKQNNVLTEKYNGCVDAMRTFRDVHIRVVAKYITIPANYNPHIRRLAQVGTGGSDLLPFLKIIRTETEDVKIDT